MVWWINDRTNPQIEWFILKLSDRSISYQVIKYRIFALALCSFLYLGGFISGLFWSSILTLPFWIIWIYFLLFLPPKNEIEGIINYTVYQMRVIGEQKMVLQDSFDHFLELGKNDFRETWINPILVTDTANEINGISTKVQTFQKLLTDFDKDIRISGKEWSGVPPMMVRFIRWHFADIIKDFIVSQQEWIKGAVPIFSKWIQAFLTNHANELKELDTSILKQAELTESLSGQWVLDLQKVRLEKHIENLDKVRARL